MKNRLNIEFEDFVKEIEKQSFFKKMFIKFSLFFNRNGLYDKWFNHKFFIDATDFAKIIDCIDIMKTVEDYADDEAEFFNDEDQAKGKQEKKEDENDENLRSN